MKVSVLAGRSASVAALVSTKVLSSSILWLVGTFNTGALLTSPTMTVKLLVALRAGTPLSVTFTVIRLVLGPWDSVGVQLSTPLLELRVIPGGGESRLKACVFVRLSTPVPSLVSTKVLSSSIVWLGGTFNTGALLTSLTMTVKLLVALRAGTPLSVTFTVIRLVLGP